MFPQFASRLIRNGATLGGNLGTGSPIGDTLPALLAPGGAAAIEIGSTQAVAVAALLEAQGLRTALHHDYGGNPRVLLAT